MGTNYQSEKNIIIKIIYIISFLVLALGLFLLLTNIKNISCSFLVNKDYVSDKVKNMRRNYAILGYSFNSELWKGIYQKHAHSGNIAFAGIILSVASIVSLVLCFSLSMKNKVINESKKQTEILKRLTDNNAPKSLEQKLIEINELKEKGLISEEEYNIMRSAALQVRN